MGSVAKIGVYYRSGPVKSAKWTIAIRTDRGINVFLDRMHTVEPPITDTLNKGHSPNNGDHFRHQL